MRLQVNIKSLQCEQIRADEAESKSLVSTLKQQVHKLESEKEEMLAKFASEMQKRL